MTSAPASSPTLAASELPLMTASDKTVGLARPGGDRVHAQAARQFSLTRCSHSGRFSANLSTRSRLSNSTPVSAGV